MRRAGVFSTAKKRLRNAEVGEWPNATRFDAQQFLPGWRQRVAAVGEFNRVRANCGRERPPWPTTCRSLQKRAFRSARPRQPWKGSFCA
eukprot:12817242-Alexandrium_andersonii.AAC.1